jgi:histone acetyltransferase
MSPTKRKADYEGVEKPVDAIKRQAVEADGGASSAAAAATTSEEAVNGDATKESASEEAKDAVTTVEHEDAMKEEEETKDDVTDGDAGENPEEETAAPNETGGEKEAAARKGAEENQNSSPYDQLRWITVTNDGKPDSMIKLVGLKSLFAKQLPKMPRAYISRLVFDRRHTSLAILSDNPALKDSDEEIIGGICYRAFKEQRFAEIAFCAVNATHQVKGYGTKLMNLLKQQAVAMGIEFFITYADNYAIGYFKKQGFTKNIVMPKGRFLGLIKDYDGGTPMECYVHPSIDYTRVPEMLQAQREFILQRVARTAKSGVVYDPLPANFSPALEGVSRANLAAARAMTIPGVLEAGWTLQDLVASTGPGKEADRQKSALKTELLNIVRKVEEQQFAWPFREPVDTKEVPDYLDVIKEPIDLSTIEKRIRQDNHYRSKRMLFADLMLMVHNCKLYNDDASTYTQCAVKLEKFLRNISWET